MITLEVPSSLREDPDFLKIAEKSFYWSPLTGILTLASNNLPDILKGIEFEVEPPLIKGISPLLKGNKISPPNDVTDFLVFQTQWGNAVTGRNYSHLVDAHLKGLCEISLPYELNLGTKISDTWVGNKQVNRVLVSKILEDKGIVNYKDLLSIRPMKYIQNNTTLVTIGNTTKEETSGGKSFWETEISIAGSSIKKSVVSWGPKPQILQAGTELRLLLLKPNGDRFWGWEYISSQRPFSPLYTVRTAGIESLIFKSLAYDTLLTDNPEFDIYKQLHFPENLEQPVEAWNTLVSSAKNTLKEPVPQEVETSVDPGVMAPIEKILDPIPFHEHNWISSDLNEYQTAMAYEIADRFSKPNDTLDLLISDVGTGKTSIFLASLKPAIDAGKSIGIVSPTTILSNQIKADSVKMYGQELTEKIHFGCYGLLTSPPVEKYDILIIDETGKHDPSWIFGAPAHHRMISSATPPNYVLTKADIHQDAMIHGHSIIRERDIKALLYNMESLPKELLDIKPRTIIMLAAINVDPDGSWKNVIHLDRLKAFIQRSVPYLKYGVVTGHDARDIERFNKGEIDTLISSNILESGINLKNAQNIWIVDAERFSLASIMQAKGRLLREWDVEQAGECILFSSTIDSDRAKAFKGDRQDILDYYTNNAKWTFAKEMGITNLPKNHLLNSDI